MKNIMMLSVIFLASLFVQSGTYCAESPDFDKCFEEQQKAIAELIQSMKDVKKVIIEKMDGDEGNNGEAKKKNPFKDKQKYEMPELKKEENPEYQLEQLREKQEKLVKELEKTSEDKTEKAKQQADITDKLEKMSANGNLNKELKKRLEDAAESSRAAEKAMNSNENSIAQTAEKKVLAELSKAINEISVKSNKESSDAGSEIKKNINRAQREMGKGNKEKADSEINEALKKAIDETKKQLGSGKFANAEKMNEISKTIKENKDKLLKGDGDKSKDEFDKMRKEISSLLRNNDSLQGMRESLNKMDELAKELKYMERNKNKTSAADIRNVLEDIQVASQEIRGYSMELSGGALPAALEMGSLVEGMLNAGKKTFDIEKLKLIMELADRLATDGNAVLANVTGNKQLNLFSTEDAPPEYRKAVSKYFERLSSGSQESVKNK